MSLKCIINIVPETHVFSDPGINTLTHSIGVLTIELIMKITFNIVLLVALVVLSTTIDCRRDKDQDNYDKYDAMLYDKVKAALKKSNMTTELRALLESVKTDLPASVYNNAKDCLNQVSNIAKQIVSLPAVGNEDLFEDFLFKVSKLVLTGLRCKAIYVDCVTIVMQAEKAANSGPAQTTGGVFQTSTVGSSNAGPFQTTKGVSLNSTVGGSVSINGGGIKANVTLKAT